MNSIQSIDAAASSFAHQLFTPFVSELTKKVALLAFTVFVGYCFVALVISNFRAKKALSELKLQPLIQKVKEALLKQKEAESKLEAAQNVLSELKKGESKSDVQLASLKQLCAEAKKRKDEAAEKCNLPGESEARHQLSVAQENWQAIEIKFNAARDIVRDECDKKKQAAEEICKTVREKSISIRKTFDDKYEPDDLFPEIPHDETAYQAAWQKCLKAMEKVKTAESELKKAKEAIQQEYSEKIDKMYDCEELKNAKKLLRDCQKAVKSWDDAKEDLREAIEADEAALEAVNKYLTEALKKAQQEVEGAQQNLDAANAELKRAKGAAKQANGGVEVNV